MRQLTFVQPGQLEWWDVPSPQITGPSQALVEPIVVASCDLDRPILRGEAPFPGPFAFGHEFVAKVVEVGEKVQRVTPGQVVVVPFQISCGTCHFCQRGLTGDCAWVPRFSYYGLGKGEWGGAFSDLVRIPFADHMLVPIPDGIAPAVIASAGDNLSDAWRCIGPHLREQPGVPILIIGGGGCGSIGLYAVALAQALGASQVDYVDWDVGRLEQASGFGASVKEGASLKRRLGAHPLTVDASTNPEGLACALRSTASGGICISTGIYFTGDIPLPLDEMYYTGMTFKTGHPHVRMNISAVLDLVSTGHLHPERITTEVATWDEAPEALLSFRTKLVVTQAKKEQMKNDARRSSNQRNLSEGIQG
jgi:threonine dehydrogenase-like Zn-dependent dehydrogenase